MNRVLTSLIAFRSMATECVIGTKGQRGERMGWKRRKGRDGFSCTRIEISVMRRDWREGEVANAIVGRLCSQLSTNERSPRVPLNFTAIFLVSTQYWRPFVSQ